ncbi:hypothetical protein HPB48_011409 [Haemaphysalis longicornis]|uniref:Uncharacterized protein n=1 Tax=Haemaphysalis longicornis TaxID=44386 RepID=A0A9J6FRH5_HAELO|nr:hypothetical protein HPB48_011409 [Haemaphysalis longicornis]
MFVISEMSDTIRIPPWQFGLDPNAAVVDQLNKRLANKARRDSSGPFSASVVVNVGLCIALFDITRIEDSKILPGDGSFHTTVQFRYVVFRPFMDEVLVGKIRSSSQEGVFVSMGFFDDILITPDGLQHPSRLYPIHCAPKPPWWLFFVKAGLAGKEISQSCEPCLG